MMPHILLIMLKVVVIVIKSHAIYIKGFEGSLKNVKIILYKNKIKIILVFDNVKTQSQIENV